MSRRLTDFTLEELQRFKKSELWLALVEEYKAMGEACRSAAMECEPEELGRIQGEYQGFIKACLVVEDEIQGKEYDAQKEGMANG